VDADVGQCHAVASSATFSASITDASAPMMARADYAVIGDLHQVLPALIEALRAR